MTDEKRLEGFRALSEAHRAKIIAMGGAGYAVHIEELVADIWRIETGRLKDYMKARM